MVVFLSCRYSRCFSCAAEAGGSDLIKILDYNWNCRLVKITNYILLCIILCFMSFQAILWFLTVLMDSSQVSVFTTLVLL